MYKQERNETYLTKIIELSKYGDSTVESFAKHHLEKLDWGKGNFTGYSSTNILHPSCMDWTRPPPFWNPLQKNHSLHIDLVF